MIILFEGWLVLTSIFADQDVLSSPCPSPGKSRYACGKKFLRKIIAAAVASIVKVFLI